MLEFSDGLKFVTSGDYRLQHEYDGWYVVGNGMLMSVNSKKEGEEWIRETEERRKNES